MYSATKYTSTTLAVILRSYNVLNFFDVCHAKSQRRAHPRTYFALEFPELPTRKYIVMWPLKPNEARILKHFLLNQSDATAKRVALVFVENAMTVERVDVLYQIEALVTIASKTPPVRQAKLTELLLEI